MQVLGPPITHLTVRLSPRHPVSERSLHDGHMAAERPCECQL